MKFILASASPRRRELLQQLGLTPQIQPADIDESRQQGERPEAYVCRLARAKAETVFERLSQAGQMPVLGADTIVVKDDRILGKPSDCEAALSALRMLSGTTHTVMTAVHLVSAQLSETRLSCSRVWFRAISDEEMQAYWETGEPSDKAGSYAIQGLGGMFVKKIEGSYTGIVGLPMYETIALLKQAGLTIPAQEMAEK